MQRLALAASALGLVASCAMEVEPSGFEVEVVDEALAGCTFGRGAFTSAWSLAPGLKFNNVTNDPNTEMNNQFAVTWLQNKSATFTLPTGSGKLIAWDDATLLPSYVAYAVNDNLWASWALSKYNSTLSDSIRSSLINIGWWGNGLSDTLFHDVGSPRFKPISLIDVEHGTQLGNCPATNGKTAQIRSFLMNVDANWTEGQSTQFIDSAVYRALDEYWSGAVPRLAGITRLNELIRDSRSSGQDLMFWDAAKKQLVDVSSRGDFDNGGTYDSATFKIGLVLYAIKAMKLNVSSTIVNDMKAKLRHAQQPIGDPNFGGLAHTVRYSANGTFTRFSGATGEATAIGLLAHSVSNTQ